MLESAQYTFSKASTQRSLSAHGNKTRQAISVRDLDSLEADTFGWRCQTLADYSEHLYEVSEPRHTSDIYSSYLSEQSRKSPLACLPTRDALARVQQASAPPATAPSFRVKIIASPIDPDNMILGAAVADTSAAHAAGRLGKCPASVPSRE